MDMLQFLRQVPLFQSLGPEESNDLASSFRSQSFKKGETLFRKGSEGTELYIIRRGSVKIVVPSSEGSEVVLAIFSEGDFFGEMSLLDGLPRSADAVALEPSEVYVLNRSDFLRFLHNNENAIHFILRSLSLRLRKTDDLLEDTCFLRIPARFAKRLLELAETHGHREGNSVEIDMQLTQSDLAGLVGASRESINKTLRLMREKGLISIEKNLIRIYDLEIIKRRML